MPKISTNVSPYISGVGKVPGFEMFLCVCVLDISIYHI